jgi:hypothetical protein
MVNKLFVTVDALGEQEVEESSVGFSRSLLEQRRARQERSELGHARLGTHRDVPEALAFLLLHSNDDEHVDHLRSSRRGEVRFAVALLEDDEDDVVADVALLLDLLLVEVVVREHRRDVEDDLVVGDRRVDRVGPRRIRSYKNKLIANLSIGYY